MQMWRYENNMFTNERGTILMVKPERDRENNYIGHDKKNDNMFQQFDVIYADELPAEPKKGDMMPGWGFKIGVPFHIVSNLGEGRYLDLVGNQAVIKTRNGFPSQGWWFDHKTRTIKSWRTRSYTLQMQSNGKSNNMVVTSTNSQWW